MMCNVYTPSLVSMSDGLGWVGLGGQKWIHVHVWYRCVQGLHARQFCNNSERLIRQKKLQPFLLLAKTRPEHLLTAVKSLNTV